jgi:uncharacterized protein YktA (UPF0223 family)
LTKDTTSNSVLYVLDSGFVFPIVRGIRAILDFANEIEDAIVVGISASNIAFRYQDYSTSVSISGDEYQEKIWCTQRNYSILRVVKFLESMKTEIVTIRR